MSEDLGAMISLFVGMISAFFFLAYLCWKNDSCWFGHRFGQWEIKELQSVGYKERRQERLCKRCNYLDTERLNSVY